VVQIDKAKLDDDSLIVLKLLAAFSFYMLFLGSSEMLEKDCPFPCSWGYPPANV
jgi:hypothetical protein